MASSYSLGHHFESFVQAQLASGRYNNASEVLRDALRLMEDREARLQALRATLNASIEAGGAHSDAALTQAPTTKRRRWCETASDCASSSISPRRGRISATFFDT